MLNRRTLRIKAMQALYGFKQCENANYYLALDQISDSFSLAEKPLDKQKAEGYKQLASLFFEENYQNHTVIQNDLPDLAFKPALDAINFYQNMVKKDKDAFGRQMVNAVDNLYFEYLLMLNLLIELGACAKNTSIEKASKKSQFVNVAINESVFLENKVIVALKNFRQLEILFIKHNANWSDQKQFVKKFYKNVVRVDETFIEYLKEENPSLESDKKVIDYIVKKLFFKHDMMVTFFDEKDINWVENDDILKSMVLRTIKSIGDDEEIELSELSKTWEEDKEFFIDLYKYTLEEDSKWENLVAENIKNWDIERVSLTDRVMIKMAIAEMIHFSSIPVKVTINEYIEIAKIYSTPKSKQFINGMLDVLSHELINQKVIRKSGRGLIDNK